MATKIEYRTYDGGDKHRYPEILLGYCKEDPIDVLKHVYMSHIVYCYKGIYTPIDLRFPNNISGLIITHVDNVVIPGCNVAIVASINDLDISQALDVRAANRTSQIFAEAMKFNKSKYLDQELFAKTVMEMIKPQKIIEFEEKGKIIRKYEEIMETLKEIVSVIMK